MVHNPFSKKDLPLPTLTNDQLDDMLRENFDMKVVRKRGIPKDFCDTVGGVATEDADGIPVCYVPVFKNPDTPDITITRKIKIEES